MYNSEERSCKHATVEKQYALCRLSMCVFVALVTQHALCRHHIVVCGLFESIFPHYLINGMIFEGGHLLTYSMVQSPS